MKFVGLIIVQQPQSGMFRLGSKNILTLKFAVKEMGIHLISGRNIIHILIVGKDLLIELLMLHHLN